MYIMSENDRMHSNSIVIDIQLEIIIGIATSNIFHRGSIDEESWRRSITMSLITDYFLQFWNTRIVAQKALEFPPKYNTKSNRPEVFFSSDGRFMQLQHQVIHTPISISTFKLFLSIDSTVYVWTTHQSSMNDSESSLSVDTMYNAIILVCFIYLFHDDHS